MLRRVCIIGNTRRVEEKMYGKRKRGRRRIAIVDDLKIKSSYEEMKRDAYDTVKWRQMLRSQVLDMLQ